MRSIGKVKGNRHFIYIDFSGRHREDETLGHLMVEDGVLYFQIEDRLADNVSIFDIVPKELCVDYDLGDDIESRRQIAMALQGKRYGAMFVGPDLRKIRVHKQDLDDNDFETVSASDYRGDIIFFRKQSKDSYSAIGHDGVLVP